MGSTSGTTGEAIRVYTVMKYGPSRGCQILSLNNTDVLFTSDISLFTTTKDNPYSVTIHSGASNTGPIVGAARLSIMTTTIKLAIGNPKSRDVVWEDMHHVKVMAPKNNYHLSLELPSGVSVQFEWKGTHDVKGMSTNAVETAKKIDNYAYKIDMKHLKLVDKSTGEVVARFIHCPLVDGKHKMIKGYFEIWKEFEGTEGAKGADMDLKFYLSCLAVQEYVER